MSSISAEITEKSRKDEMSSEALSQLYGKHFGRETERRRKKKLAVTGEGRRAG